MSIREQLEASLAKAKAANASGIPRPYKMAEDPNKLRLDKRRRERANLYLQLELEKRMKGSGAVAEKEEIEGDGEGGGEEEDDGNLEYCAECRDEDGEELLCCDRCPLSFHVQCVGLKEVPEGEYLCPECAVAFPKKTGRGGPAEGPVCTVLYTGEFLGRLARFSSVRDELQDILFKLRDHDFAPTFNSPVNVKTVPGYSDVVRRPMDYGSIQKELQSGKYGTSAATLDVPRLVANLRLVVYNAKLFNRPGSVLWRMAEVLFRATETALRDRVRMNPEQRQRLADLMREEMSETLPEWTPVIT